VCLCVTGPLQAQSTVRPEVRLDAIAATNTSLQLGAAVMMPAGLYVRWGLVAGAGPVRRTGVTRMAAHVDVMTRFLMDPMRESPFGLYGLAGVSGVYDGRGSVEPRVVAGLGLEGRRRGGMAPAVEVALGGGLRMGIVLRAARPNRR
jgi:hypothetical protein